MQADNYTVALVGLAVAIMVLVVWLGWFLLARVTLYEIGPTVPISPNEPIVADFPSAAQGRIQVGQRALVRLEGSTGAALGPVPALVTDVVNVPEQEAVRVQVYALWNEVGAVPPEEGATGRVEVEAESLSPAMLVMRTAGQFVETPSMQTSPQQPVNGQERSGSP